MDNDKVEILRLFINLYDKAVDKEAFMTMWRNFVNAKNEPLTLEDAFDAVEGEASAQVYANMEE